MTKEITYRITFYDKEGELNDVYDSFLTEVDALSYARKHVAHDGFAHVEQITVIGLVRVERSKKIVVTKIK